MLSQSGGWRGLGPPCLLGTNRIGTQGLSFGFLRRADQLGESSVDRLNS